MISDLEQRILEFMKEQYSLHISKNAIHILQGNGFIIHQDILKQFDICNNVQKKLTAKEKDNLLAKVFSLAYPYDFVLSQEDGLIRKWSAWLGIAEQRLSFKLKRSPWDKILIKKALEHLLTAREKGDEGRENASYIGNCYYALGEPLEALDFFMEAMEKGNQSKENTSRIGNCYLKLKDYEKAAVVQPSNTNIDILSIL